MEERGGREGTYVQAPVCMEELCRGIRVDGDGDAGESEGGSITLLHRAFYNGRIVASAR